MIKRILVPLDPSPFSETALDLACTIAKIYKAEVTGLVILDIPGIEDSIGPVPIGGIHYAERLEKEKKEEAKEHIEQLLEKFSEKCKKEGVRYRESERQGSPSSQIIEESLYYDLLFIGLKTYFHFETSDKAGDSLEKILKNSITPIYGVPEKVAVLQNLNRKIRIMIAFDGSLLAARAMQRFAQLIDPSFYEITLLNSSEDQELGEQLLTRAEDYLKTHHINEIKKIWTSENIIDVIKNIYYEKMDGFVVGTHAREGILDFFVGSLTKYLLKTAKKPVFIG